MGQDQTPSDSRDTDYEHHDLVVGYLGRRGVKTFHVRQIGPTGETVCGKNTAAMIDGGWARQLRRRGLNLCSKCAHGVALDAPVDEEE